MNDPRRCETCLFFEPEPPGQRSECRRMPPQIIWNETIRTKETYFPATNRASWCGEYEPITPVSDAPEPPE